MRFEKWQGAGNAYLVIEESELPAPLAAAHVRRICHADLGAGGDGILLLARRTGETPRVRILNPDGSEAEFSGNGTRIAIGYLAAHGAPAPLAVETLRGTIRGAADGRAVTVDAGLAALEGPGHAPDGGEPPAAAYTFVSLGNPHCVVEEPGLEALDLAGRGSAIEHHPWFPSRANVEFYRVRGPRAIDMRVWERGAGETLSSGSGASAAAVAAVVAGRVASPVTVHAPGGELVVEVGADLAVRLSGPVEPILEGTFAPAFLASLEST